MIERQANLWELSLTSSGAPDALCITTNGAVDASGRCVMGRGCAKEASQIYPGIAYQLGLQIKANGNIVQVVNIATSTPIVAFPVKYHWKQQANLELIAKSCHQLMGLIASRQWKRVVLPRPGCGNGQRNWEIEVKPLCESILDDRVLVVHL